jgi:hypothetical protein
VDSSEKPPPQTVSGVGDIQTEEELGAASAYEPGSSFVPPAAAGVGSVRLGKKLPMRRELARPYPVT